MSNVNDKGFTKQTVRKNGYRNKKKGTSTSMPKAGQVKVTKSDGTVEVQEPLKTTAKVPKKKNRKPKVVDNSWKRVSEPPTDGQMLILDKLNYTGPKPITYGEAKSIISKLLDKM